MVSDSSSVNSISESGSQSLSNKNSITIPVTVRTVDSIEHLWKQAFDGSFDISSSDATYEGNLYFGLKFSNGGLVQLNTLVSTAREDESPTEFTFNGDMASIDKYAHGAQVDEMVIFIDIAERLGDSGTVSWDLSGDVLTLTRDSGVS